MPTETLTYTYTTQAEIERLYGKTGVAAITADLQGTNIASMWEEIIADATLTIDSYASQVYDQEDLATSRWVRNRATWLAAYRLSQRKGNNDLYAQRYQEIIDELEKVKSLILIIPNIPTSSDLTPAMSNISIDPRYNIRKVRVNPEISTGGTSDRQDISWSSWLADFY